MKKTNTNPTSSASRPSTMRPITASSDLSRQLAILTKELRTSNSFKQKVIGALITGFGTVIGATVLVALLIFLLTQLASIEMIRPMVQSIVEIVQTSPK
ncbi:hypothetical protein IT411_02155 [Candidatus Peregrinibacteria bacterium]|nr:hypothetical protein [Candidatus Peregrinibacteria bacterium]